MTPSWQFRDPLLAGWWIAVAQNVAPKRFHARETRRLCEQRRQMLAESGMAIYSLAGVPVEDDRSDAGEVAMMGGLAVAARGALGRRRASGVVVSSLSTSQRTPGGGQVRFTSYRHGSGTELDERQRAMLVHHFLTGAGVVDDDPRVERCEVSFTPSVSRQLIRVPDDAWSRYVVRVDGQQHPFKRVTFGEHWLALGVVNDVDLAIEGHGFDADPLELVTTEDTGGGPEV